MLRTRINGVNKTFRNYQDLIRYLNYLKNIESIAVYGDDGKRVSFLALCDKIIKERKRDEK